MVAAAPRIETYTPADVHAALTEAFLGEERPIPHVLRLPLEAEPTVKLVDLTSQLHRGYPPASDYTPEAARETQRQFLEAGEAFFGIRLLGNQVTAGSVAASQDREYLFGRPFFQRTSLEARDRIERRPVGVRAFAAAEYDDPEQIIAVQVERRQGTSLQHTDITSVNRRRRGEIFQATHQVLRLLDS